MSQPQGLLPYLIHLEEFLERVFLLLNFQVKTVDIDTSQTENGLQYMLKADQFKTRGVINFCSWHLLLLTAQSTA